MKLVDVPDSKSGVVHPTCRFDSGLRHIKLPFGSFLVAESNLRFSPLTKRYLIVLLGRVAFGILNSHLGVFLVAESNLRFSPLTKFYFWSLYKFIVSLYLRYLKCKLFRKFSVLTRIKHTRYM